jgi:Pyridoxamine 5'-phosphate oxidase
VALLNDDVAELLDRPSPAVLTTYRADGTAVASPVWYRRTGDWLEVVIADGDVKLRHLARRPESALLIFEATTPFRAVRVEGIPILERVGVTDARRIIARRYLGIDRSDAFTDSRGSATIARFPLSGARTWDLSGILPT